MFLRFYYSKPRSLAYQMVQIENPSLGSSDVLQTDGKAISIVEHCSVTLS